MMNREKTDLMIKEKIEMLRNFPAPGVFDKQHSWERMENMLQKRVPGKYHWWKYAAIFLLLLTGMYLLYIHPHWAASDMGNNAPEKNAITHHTVQLPLKNNHTESRTALNIAKAKKSIRKERPTQSKRGKVVAVKTKRSEFQNNAGALSAETMAHTGSVTHDTLRGHPEMSTVTIKKSMAASRPAIVYYNEIVSASDEDNSSQEAHTGLSIGFGNKRYIQQQLVVNQPSLESRLKIYTTHKNQ